MMSRVTSADLQAAREAVPLSLRRVAAAVQIQALLVYTARAGETRLKPVRVSLTIPPRELEPLLVSGFVRLEHLTPLEGGRYRVVVEGGRLRVPNNSPGS